MERRLITTELRATTTDGKRKIGGYAAVFNSLSVVLWDFREEIAPGAFADAIARTTCGRCGIMIPMGSWALQPTAHCFWRRTLRGCVSSWSCRIHSVGGCLHADRARDVSQMSFGFRSLPDGSEWRIDEDGMYIRRLLKADLLEVSPVTFPAYLPPAWVCARRSWAMRCRFLARCAGRRRLSVSIAWRLRRGRVQAMTETDIQLAARMIRDGE